MNWIIFWIDFLWNSIELNIELNHFLTKFKYWIESIWVSFTPTPQYQYWESRFAPWGNKAVFSSPGIMFWGIEKLRKRSDLHPAFSCSVSGSRLKNSRRKSLAREAFQHLMGIERAKKAPHISTASDFSTSTGEL